MTDSGLSIIKSGPLSLIQDAGRKHVQYLGLAEGGPCDAHAFFWANYLLGNSNFCAVVEITFGPFEGLFQSDAVISICGANLNCTINNESVVNWSSHKVKKGDVIRFIPGNNGIRAYLAIKNGFKTPQHFGSFSEVVREGFFQKAIENGLTLHYEKNMLKNWRLTSVPDKFIPNYKSNLILRVIPSYQYKDFNLGSKKIFEQSQYAISPNSDRMGYRLKGQEVQWSGKGIISEGIAFGSVQIPPDGQPIVLLNDRQTIGGYPKIGCVCKKDCSQLMQRQANQKISFKFIDAELLQTIKYCHLHPTHY